MAFVNYATKNLAIKIVYYGPGLSGKTTNLRYIFFKLDASYRGDFICLETETERTFFFDLLPIKAGLIGEFKVHFQLMTVPGQAFYEASRKSVLKGADGIIFVSDSQIPLLDANLENFDGLRRNCLEHNIDLNQIPLVFQYNKRDLNYLIPVETFNNLLNPRRLPFVEAAAINGVGVFESLREISKLTVPVVREKVLGEKRKEFIKAEVPEEFPTEAVSPRELPKENVEFITPSQASPFQVTKIKMKSQKEIEQELEKISKEFGTKDK
jgi:hypothetical protein